MHRSVDRLAGIASAYVRDEEREVQSAGCSMVHHRSSHTSIERSSICTFIYSTSRSWLSQLGPRTGLRLGTTGVLGRRLNIKCVVPNPIPARSIGGVRFPLPLKLREWDVCILGTPDWNRGSGILSPSCSILACISRCCCKSSVVPAVSLDNVAITDPNVPAPCPLATELAAGSVESRRGKKSVS
jgi:hypothetical protein